MGGWIETTPQASNWISGAGFNFSHRGAEEILTGVPLGKMEDLMTTLFRLLSWKS